VYALAAWRADQGVRPEDWAELESDNELELKPGSLAQLLNIAYDGDVLAIDAATQHLEEIRNWVRHEPNTRHDRLRALLLRGRSGAEVIDPTAALSDYPTSPWAAALAVDIVLGDSVAFYWKDPSDYGESYIQLGDHWVHASSAGLRSVSSPKVSVGVESGEIFAMLALEMAADRVRRHDLRVALLLAGLAERSAAVANGASAALANKCGIAEGGAPVSLGARIGAWSNLGDWPSAGPDDVQLSVGARMLIAGLEDGC